MPLSPGYQLYKHLREPGGSEQMAVDGSMTPVTFRLTAPAGIRYVLGTVNFYVLANGIRPGTFFGLAELTNGCLVRWLDPNDTVLMDFTDGVPIKRQNQLGALAGAEILFIDQLGMGAPDSWKAQWDFREEGNNLRALRIEPGYSLALTVRDNLTGITSFRALVHGFEETS